VEQAEREELIRRGRFEALTPLLSSALHELAQPNHIVALNLPVLEDAWRDAVDLLESLPGSDPALRLGGLPYTELAQVIDELRQSSQRQAGLLQRLHTHLKRERLAGVVSLDEVVRGALELLASAVKKATRSFEVSHGDVPSVPGDRSLLDQAVVSLVLGACHSLTDSSQAVSVTTRATAQAAILEVADEGPELTPREECTASMPAARAWSRCTA
jgi:signal transduction histidine kinase